MCIRPVDRTMCMVNSGWKLALVLSVLLAGWELRLGGGHNVVAPWNSARPGTISQDGGRVNTAQHCLRGVTTPKELTGKHLLAGDTADSVRPANANLSLCTFSTREYSACNDDLHVRHFDSMYVSVSVCMCLHVETAGVI